MRCADLGCGSGDVTFEMAALAGPTGSAVGIDIDLAELEPSRAAARERGLVNVAFEMGDVGSRAASAYARNGPAAVVIFRCRAMAST